MHSSKKFRTTELCLDGMSCTVPLAHLPQTVRPTAPRIQLVLRKSAVSRTLSRVRERAGARPQRAPSPCREPNDYPTTQPNQTNDSYTLTSRSNTHTTTWCQHRPHTAHTAVQRPSGISELLPPFPRAVRPYQLYPTTVRLSPLLVAAGCRRPRPARRAMWPLLSSASGTGHQACLPS